MKYTYKAVLTIFSLFISLGAFAQDYTFKVLSKKGEVTADGKNIFVGSKIQEDQTIKMVGYDSYLGLTFKNGRTLELKEPGTFKVADLAKKVDGEVSSVYSKYASFLAAELTGGGENGYASRVKTGSVTRALNGIQINAFVPSFKPYVTLGRYPNSRADKTLIKWYYNENADNPVKPVSMYNVKLVNMFKEEIASYDVKEEMLEIDFNDPIFSGEDIVLIRIKANDQNYISKEFSYQLMSEDEEAEISAELSQLPNDGSAIAHLIRARFFEDKELFGNAMYHYEQALKINDTEQYRKIYDSFIDRNHLKRYPEDEAEASVK